MLQEKLPSVMNMVLFTESFTLTKAKLEAAAQAHGIEDFKVVTEDHDAESSVVFWNGVPFMIMNMDQPIPHDTFHEVLNFSFGLDDGKKIVEKQKAHAIISPLNESEHMGQSISNAVGVMEMSALVARIQQPVGHYWSHSDTLYSQKQFIENVERMRKAMEIQYSGQDGAGSYLPYMFWVGFRLIGSSEPGKAGAYTKGLESFTGYELEITPTQLQPEVLGNRIYAIVEHMFNNGPVLQDGNTVGVSEEERFRLVWHEGTETAPARFSMILECGV